MIEKFVIAWNKRKEEIKAKLRSDHPKDYMELVKWVVEILDLERCGPDPERIHLIDDGDYQGTLLFIISERGYQPSTYWSVKISYGSCSGCDTLQAISDYSSAPPNEEQASDYMTLALHIIQGLHVVGEEAPE
jgi:hypothetical protein